MVASLVMQLPVPPPDLGDVADQHQRADRHAGRQQRQRPLQHGRAAGLDLLAGRGVAAQRRLDPLAGVAARQRVVGEPAGHRGQVLADEVRGQAEAAVRRLGVRARVGDPAAARRAGSARRRPGARWSSRPAWRGGRERAVGHHLGQVVGAGQVVHLQLARGTGGGEVGVAADDRDHLHPVAAAHRDRLVPGRGVAVPDRVALAPDPALGVGDRQVRHLGPGQEPADVVVLVRGRRRSSGAPARRRRTRGRPSARRAAAPCAPAGSTATHSSRSAKERSAISCQSPASRCRCSTSIEPRVVCSSTRSRSVDTRQRVTAGATASR